MGKLIRWLSMLTLLIPISLAASPIGTVFASQQTPKATTGLVIKPALSSGSGSDVGKGFDTCGLPSITDMWNFWVNTPCVWYNVYIGGSNYSCRPATVTADWLNKVNAQGWRFLFNWVGPQPPCAGTRYYTFSSDPTTAYNQGWNEGANAFLMLLNLGITNQAQGTAIVYDLESSPDQNNPSCLAAKNSFFQGWVDYFNAGVAQVPGVYGGVCATNLASLATLNRPPSFIWGADWNLNPSTSDLNPGCSGGIPSYDWTQHQRFKQYQGGHKQTYNGTTLNIDSDCANGPTSPSGSYTDTSCL